MSDNIMVIVVSGIVGLVLIVFSILLLSGKGGSLIAGYNTMSEIEKASYDEPALCRFMGKILLPVGILCPGIAIAAVYDITWLMGLLIVVMIALVIYAIVYCNTGNRFRR